MPSRNKLINLVFFSVLVLALAVMSSGCATCGVNVFLGPGKRALNALKNRTMPPAAADFDPRLSLDALLAPGQDRSRWQPTRAGAIEGDVVRVHDAEPESANCFSGSRLDTHIEIARRPDAPPNERVIVEVTPPMRDWANGRGLDWSTATLRRQLTGRRARIEGWLLFDDEHEDEAENTRPRHRGNWRATAWEIHPVTAIVVQDDRPASSTMAGLPRPVSKQTGRKQCCRHMNPTGGSFGRWSARSAQ